MPISINGTGTITGISAGGLPSGIVTGDTISNGSVSTVDIADGSITAQKLGYQNFNFRNRIINGDMRIDQRNAGASVTQNTTIQYTLDRWFVYGNVTSKYTAQQNAASVTPPAGYANYLGVTSSSVYSVAAGDLFFIGQYIEGFNFYDFNWGTENAQAITLSFWVRSSLTGTFGGGVQSSAQTRSYPFSYTISAANTWEKKTITIAGDTSGTWVGATNGVGLRLYFSVGMGSTYSGTSGIWGTTDYRSVAGAVSVVGTNGATFYITGVQLEAGSTATDFERRPYGTELALCQRYYENGGGGTQVQWSGNTTNTAPYYANVYFRVEKRATPTTIVTASNANFGFPATASTVGGSNKYEFRLDRTANSTQSGGYFGDSWTASAEL